jgi:hypothetical protein
MVSHTVLVTIYCLRFDRGAVHIAVAGYIVDHYCFMFDRGVVHIQGRIQDFKLGGAHLKKAKGGAKIFGVFRVKNHDFTPKKIIFFPILGGGAPPLNPPLILLWLLYCPQLLFEV